MSLRRTRLSGDYWNGWSTGYDAGYEDGSEPVIKVAVLVLVIGILVGIVGTNLVLLCSTMWGTLATDIFAPQVVRVWAR